MASPLDPLDRLLDERTDCDRPPRQSLTPAKDHPNRPIPP